MSTRFLAAAPLGTRAIVKRKHHNVEIADNGVVFGAVQSRCSRGRGRRAEIRGNTRKAF